MRLASLLLFLIISLSAFADPSTKTEVSPSDTTSSATVPPAPETDGSLSRLIEPFAYDRAIHSRDPFRLPEVALQPLMPGDVFGPFMELHEMPLDEIKVQGIILDLKNSRAIVSRNSPENKDNKKKKTYLVKVGDALGENFGRIQSIQDGKIVILQTLEENGALRTTTHVLSVRKYNLKSQ